MKKSTKRLLFIALITMTSLITFGFSGTDDSTPGILTVRTTEVMNGIWDNSMTTVYPDGRMEKVELEKLKMKDLSSNLNTINQHLNALILKGYKLNSVAGGNGDGIIVTTYILARE